MTQLSLFDWTPPPLPAVFPYYRRQSVLRDIAETFVREGFDAGNRKMTHYGWRMVADLLRSGVSDQFAVAREIERFTAAARAVALDHIEAAGHCGEQPFPPRPEPDKPTRRIA